MQVTIQIPKQITITHIKITLPIYYRHDVPENLPLLKEKGKVWDAIVNIDTGEILGWPQDPDTWILDIKVQDEGQYALLQHLPHFESAPWLILRELQDYVPHGVVPGEYGDYVRLEITNGIITNWPKKPDVSAFFDVAQLP